MCVDKMCMAVIYAVPLVQPEDVCCPRERDQRGSHLVGCSSNSYLPTAAT